MAVINPNLRHLCASYNEGKRGVVLLGSSRSGKTYSCIDFFLWLASKKVTGKTINIIRETYHSFKTTLYNDFNERLPAFGIASPFQDVQERSSFKLFGNKFNLIGADKPSKFMGAGCDFLWINEGMHVPKSIFDQSEMRCNTMFIIDSNPEEEEHYIYDSVATRPDVSLLKTTFNDNPFCPPMQRLKILSYNPWHPDDAHLPESERRPHPENTANGTADAYMWKVFGLGERAERKGRIYPNLFKYSDGDLPNDASFLGFGGDGGFNPDPTVIIGVWRYENNLYLKEYVYGTELDPEEVANRMRDSGIKDNEHDEPDDIVMDAAEPMLIAYLKRTAGFRIWKGKGTSSVQGNIRMMRQYKIHIHEDSRNIQRDFENFCWKWNELTDAPTGEPEKKFKHSHDAAAYCVYRSVGREL